MLTIGDIKRMQREYDLADGTTVVLGVGDDKFRYADCELEVDSFDELNEEAVMDIRGEECLVIFAS